MTGGGAPSTCSSRNAVSSAESGRERKYYQVTAKGRTTLREEGERFAAVSGLVLRVIGASHA